MENQHNKTGQPRVVLKLEKGDYTQNCFWAFLAECLYHLYPPPTHPPPKKSDKIILVRKMWDKSSRNPSNNWRIVPIPLTYSSSGGATWCSQSGERWSIVASTRHEDDAMFVHHLTQDVTYSTGNTRREALHTYTSSVNQTVPSVPESRLFTIYTFLYKNRQNTGVKLDIPHTGSKNINVIHNKNESTVTTHKCKQWGSFLFLKNLSLQTNIAGLLFCLKEVFWSGVEGVQRGPLSDRKGKVIQYKGAKDRKWAGTNNGKPGARNLEAESTRSRAESMRGCVKLCSIPSVWPMGRFSIAVVDKVTLALNHLDHLKNTQSITAA